MKVKSINVVLNDYCNNKCESCFIWKNKNHHDLSPNDLELLLERFPETEDISLTGGEPFLKPDLLEIIKAVVNKGKHLKMMFINTNGTLPERVKEVMSGFSFPNTYLSVSLEGPEEVHNKLRGVRSYISVLKTLEHSGLYRKVISTTLQRDNSTIPNMVFLMDCAKKFDADLTFRFASSGPYYKNESSPPTIATPDQVNQVMKFMKNYRTDNFFEMYDLFLKTGSAPIMKNDGVIRCKAGELFITVNAEGQIYPCIFSSRSIGNIRDGIRAFNDRGKYEPCPCFTECTIYPMLNHGGKEDGTR